MSCTAFFSSSLSAAWGGGRGSKESFPPKVVSGLCELRPFPAFGFLNNFSFRTVENFALRVVGNLWQLLAFF